MAGDAQDYRAWLTLSLLPDLGRGGINKLIRRFGSPEAVLDASEAEILTVDGVGPMSVRSILNRRDLVDVDSELKLIDKHGVCLTSILDDDYPANLRAVAVPPPLLYYRGTLDPMDEAAVGVIGIRKISLYGRDACRHIVTELVGAGVTIVSGLAIGVDGAAHQNALDAGGRTLGVLGLGLSKTYPAQHKKLGEKIVENGALISEMPMAAPIDPGSFPQRNAIIAGLSLGVVVIEAARKSGTFITAGYALEENRSVYAVPGDITRVNSLGTNRLIQDGAHLVSSGRDVLLDLKKELRHLLDDLPDIADPDQDAPPPLPKDLSDTEQLILEVLVTDPLSIDQLSEALADKAAVSPSSLMAALLNLEIRALVRQEPGKRFRRMAI